MIKKRTWGDFRKTGLLLIINQILHVFGWAIVLEFEDDQIVNAYPARVKFRGFDEDSTTQAYKNVSKYMKDHSSELDDEVNI